MTYPITEAEFVAYCEALKAGPHYAPAMWGVLWRCSAVGLRPEKTHWLVLNEMEENTRSAAAWMKVAGLLRGGELVRDGYAEVRIAPPMLQGLREIFAVYWDAAVGDAHKNIQAVQHMLQYPAAEHQEYWLVMVADGEKVMHAQGHIGFVLKFADALITQGQKLIPGTH